MLYLKNNPVGIDKTINDINETVYNSLGWTPENNISYNAYSRALKNPRNGGIVPEVYKVEDVTTGIPFGEYSEVLYDDNVNASSFFYVDDNVSAVDNGRLFTTTISMVFQLDLSVVANNILHRGDEEIHRKIVNAINDSTEGRVNAVITNIPSVYSEFDISQIEFTDMHPFHCFRVDIDVDFEYECCVDCELIKPTDQGFLLLEDNGFLLLEDGFKIIIN